MTITHASGKTSKAIALSQHGGCIRVAVQGSEDPVEFTAVNGKWLSEDGEPVQMEFEWQRHASNELVSEADCICPKELASVLIQSLQGDSQADDSQGDSTIVLSMGASCC